MTTITVRPPEPSDWQNAASINTDPELGGSYDVVAWANGELSLPIDFLTPGRTYRVRLNVQVSPLAQTGGTIYAVLDGASRALPTFTQPTRWVEWTTTADRPVRIDIRSITNIRVHGIELSADVPAAELERPQLPVDVLALDVMAPRAGADTFRLDSSRLDRDALDAGRPAPGVMVLGRGRLGASYLYTPELTEWWRPVLGKARAVSTRRGVSGVVVPTAEVGTLTAEFPNYLDPRAMALRQGAPVRLYHWPDRRPLFVGRLTRAVVQPHKPGGALRYVTTIEAADAVAELAAITRHGAIGVETWEARASRLMASASALALPWRIIGAVNRTNPRMGNTVLETSLAKHLDVLAASARGAWWVDAQGVVTLVPGEPIRDVAATFTDRRTPDDVAPWGYVDAAAGWDWQAVVSVVEATNYGAAWDSEQGEYREDNTEHTATNPTLAATYGTQSAKLETNLDSDTAAADLAEALVRDQDGLADVTAVQLDALGAMDRAAALDLFALVATELRGEKRHAHVANIAHSITPRAWATQVALMERKITDGTP